MDNDNDNNKNNSDSSLFIKNSFVPGWIDCHSHLSDPRLADSLVLILSKARDHGIRYFIQGGLGPKDWELQLELCQHPFFLNQDCFLLPSFGLHPYWVSEHTEVECESALSLLAKYLAHKKVVAIGELGLDFRKKIIENAVDPEHVLSRQRDCFSQQLELARFAHLPVVLHLVRAHQESLRMLQLWGPFPAQGMVHSFNGSYESAKDFLDLGFLISVGGPLCFQRNERLRQAIQKIPLDLLLLESDSPDQAPEGNFGLNEPFSILAVAKVIADLKNCKADEVLDRTSANARKLFKRGFL